jgi:hypothetical protein
MINWNVESTFLRFHDWIDISKWSKRFRCHPYRCNLTEFNELVVFVNSVPRCMLDGHWLRRFRIHQSVIALLSWLVLRIIIYPTCIDPSDKHNNLQKIYVQTLPKSRIVTSRNSDLNSGVLETAEQSEGMQRYHELCLRLKSALKLLILGWVVVYDKYNRTRVRSSSPDRTRWFSPAWKPSTYGLGPSRPENSTRAIRWLGSDTRAVFLVYITRLDCTLGNGKHVMEMFE